MIRQTGRTMFGLTHPLPLAKFTYNKDSQSLLAEASDFGPLRDGRWWLQRLYPDACDQGISILSHHTGRIEIFYLDREETHDGELLAFHFKPVDEKCKIRAVTILND